MTPPSLDAIIAALETIAPLRYAGSWDNVGLLVEPEHAEALSRPISRALLAIDLTEPVMAEAIALDVQLIVAYHPPIFSGLKRLTTSRSSTRILLRAIQRGIAIYSPHTALDAAPDGLNDWLLEAFGALTHVAPIEPVDPDLPAAGAGRTATLALPQSLDAVLTSLKTHLDLPFLRVAATDEHADGEPISSVAVCPGAGGSLFAGVRNVDLMLTGEMRHHDVLARVARGTTVVLTDHTNTERGYLPRLEKRLSQALGEGLALHVSARDRDPLEVR